MNSTQISLVEYRSQVVPADDWAVHVHWHFCKVPTGFERVCFRGWTGSDLKTTRMTRLTLRTS
jgi:hypothetical protein